MNPNAKRQIKDIQVRAEHLINGRPTLIDLEELNQYNEELKTYLINNLDDMELVNRVRQIPRILENSSGELAGRGALSAFFAMFAPALVAYFQERHQIENAKDAMREVRGAYATIEFFTRHVEQQSN